MIFCLKKTESFVTMENKKWKIIFYSNFVWYEFLHSTTTTDQFSLMMWSKNYQYWIRYVILNYDTFLFFLFLFWNVCFGSHRFLATMTKTVVVVVPWFQRNRNGFFFPKSSNRVVALVFPCKTTTTQAIWILFTIKQWVG